MKAFHCLRTAARGAALLTAGLGLWAALARGAALPADPATGYVTVRGEITAMTDQTLTLDDDTLVFYDAMTACTEDEAASMLADLAVGERVKVTCFQDALTGDRRAVAIGVRD